MDVYFGVLDDDLCGFENVGGEREGNGCKANGSEVRRFLMISEAGELL